MLKKIALRLIRFYQKWVSPLFPRRCRYYPTCSAYAYEAFKKHGILKGFYLALWRLLRCNPFSPGGYDPVPERFVFFPKPPEPQDDDF